MIFLLLFAFLAGIVTILSPCILPILPIVLSGSIGSGKRKPLGIVSGFVLSFTFFTLFLATIVQATGLSPDALRSFSIIIILLFGVSLLLPKFQVMMERLFSILSNKVSVQGKNANRQGFGGGFLIGLSLGLVWTPCVGPIIASVITLAATSSVNFAAFFITLAYSLGTAIPMFAVMIGGRGLLQRIPWLLPNTEKIQKAFGVLMILTAIGIFFNIDRKFQSYILDKFPSYGAGLTSLEDNKTVQKQLQNLFEKKADSNDLGKPISDIQQEFGKAPELIPGGEWFNSSPLTLSALRGKVVLVDFWTYTCINCIRTLPYLADWYEKYEDKGLVIIGVHTPEFAFEQEAGNVQQAIKDFEIKYPVMQDNDYATWGAYNNRYWPAKYLIDKTGKIRFTHFGEGEYSTTENKIQELLKEAGSSVSIPVKEEEAKSQAKFVEISPETYLGSGRMQFLYPDGKVLSGTHTFTLEQNIPQNSFSFGGKWTIEEEYSESGEKGVLEYNFIAKKVFLVMRASGIGEKRVKVLLDDKVITDGKGVDVLNGFVTIDEQRLYELVSLNSVSPHTLRLEFLSPGIQAYAFTFGN